MRKNVLSILFFLTAAALFSAEPKTELCFTGTMQVGKEYRFSVHAGKSSVYTLKLPGAQPVRQESVEVKADGVLILLSKTDESRTFEFRIGSLDSAVDQKAVAFKDLSGRTLRIESVRGKQPKFQLLPEDPGNKALNAADSVLGGGNAGHSSDELDPKAEKLLASFFLTVTDTPAAYFGEKRLLAEKEKFQIDPVPLTASLKARGIAFAPKQVEGYGVYTLHSEINSFPVDRIDLVIQGKDIPGYDFKLEVSLLYPAGKYAGSAPIQVRRNAFEVLCRPLPENNPLYSGMQMEVVNRDQLDLTLFPVDLQELLQKDGKKFLFF